MKFLRSIFLAALAIIVSTTPTFAVTPVPQEGGFAKLSDLVIVFANLVAVVTTFAGFGVLFMFIRGGVAYITAQGDQKALTSARATLTWAVVGLIVILSSYIIISIIVGFVAVPGLGSFCLPTAGEDAATFCK